MANGILVVVLPSRGALSPRLIRTSRRGPGSRRRTGTTSHRRHHRGNAAALASDVAARGSSKVLVVEHASLSDFTEETYAKAAACRRESRRLARDPSFHHHRPCARRAPGRPPQGRPRDRRDRDPARRQGPPRLLRRNLIAEVEFKTSVAVLTVAPMTFPRAEPKGSAAPIEPSPSTRARLRASSSPSKKAPRDRPRRRRKDRRRRRGLGAADGFRPL